MTVSAARAWPRAEEAGLLEHLRAQYTEQGFTFTVQPGRAQLPEFLGTYRPDAIAQKPGINIAVEVKRSPSPETRLSLQRIRRLFEGHPDWRFTVAYAGNDSARSIVVGSPQPAAIRNRMDEIKALVAQGHRSAAFILAWSLLEAASRRILKETPKGSRTPGSVVQDLAMHGHIEPETEQRLRVLIDLRNKIVHGDLDADPADADVELVQSAVAGMLAENPV